MARTLKVHKPTPCEMRWLTFLEGDYPPQVQRRAETILCYGLGSKPAAIADTLHVHVNTTYADLQVFARERLNCLHSVSVGGAPRRITLAQQEKIWHWAEIPPRELGLLDPRWTLANFREFLVKCVHAIKRISLEHLRRVLKKRTFASAASSANSSALIRAVR
jgi:transposase